MTEFRTGDRVRVLRSEMGFKGALATVRKVPGVHGEDTVSVRVDGYGAYASETDGHSLKNGDLELAESGPRSDVQVEVSWRVQTTSTETPYVFKSFYVAGGGMIRDFNSREEAQTRMDHLYVRGSHRVVKVTRVSAEMIEVYG